MKPVFRRVLIGFIAVLVSGTALIAGTIFGLTADPDGDFPAGTTVIAKNSLRKFLGISKTASQINRDIGANIPLPCPVHALVVVTGGQSNAANAISTPRDADPTLPVFMFFDGKCYALRDPLLGASGGGGSVWSRLGPILSARTGKPVVLVNGAIGGSQYDDWLDPKLPYMNWLRDRVAKAALILGPADIVLWHQGETDAWFHPARGEIQPKIKAVASTVLKSFALKPTAKLVMYRASICIGKRRKSGVPSIIAAQTAVANSNSRIVPGPNTDQFGLRFRHDGCHLNEAGARRMAEQSADLVAPLLARP